MKFIAARADEARDKAISRPRIDFLRRADLLDAATVHDDDDTIRHRHRLDLIVGDIQTMVLRMLLCRRLISARITERN